MCIYICIVISYYNGVMFFQSNLVPAFHHSDSLICEPGHRRQTEPFIAWLTNS